MTVHYDAHGVTLHHGDCLDILATLPDASVDAVVTDPPYGLEFMGKEWDAPWKNDGAVIRDPATERGGFQDGNGGNPYSRSRIEYGRGDMAGFQAWCTLWAAECLRVLKPGGHLLAFGGTRTWHRLACAIEDAGFEIRDSIAWMYGSGFPKSLDVAKAIVSDKDAMGGPNYKRTHKGDPVTAAAAAAWHGWGTALKPAHEPIVVARKPLAGTVAANVLAHGTGALNIDATRIETTDDLNGGAYAAIGGRGESASLRAGGGMNVPGKTVGTEYVQPAGRWPANVVLDESQAAALDAQSGESAATRIEKPAEPTPDERTTYGAMGAARPARGFTDTGGASRFLYVAKADADERPRVNGMAHATVKPIALMRWLVRLVTPPGGTVLEPFAGSGTTAEACLLEGFRCIAVEREADYLPLIVARITRQRDPVAHIQLVGDDHPTLFDEELA